MHVRHQTRAWALVVVASLSWLSPLHAETTPGAHAPAPAKHTLTTLFEAAWVRQPQAQSYTSRRLAVESAKAANSAWMADAPALLLQGQTDHPGSGAGSRELEVGVALPLWLPGQRQHALAVSDAQARVLNSGLGAQRLQLAGLVRSAWWQVQRTQAELALARTRLSHAGDMADDVARRVRAGDLARADQHQAESARAQAEAALAEAIGTSEIDLHALRALTGLPDLTPEHLAASTEGDVAAPLPALDALDAPAADGHPLMAEARAQQSMASAQADLAASSRRANPELTVLATHNRGQAGDPYQQSVTVGLRLPFGAGARADARQADALANAQEAQAVTRQLQAGLQAQAASALARLRSAHAQWQATQRMAQLAQESRRFFDKSFQLGETDLPTRLRIEQEAVQAQKALNRARIDVAAAWSAWWQAMGELPKP